MGRQRALGRKMVNALPQRCLPTGTNDIRDPLRTTMSSRKPLVTRNTNKGRRSCMPEMMVLPMPRQSISERKAIPGIMIYNIIVLKNSSNQFFFSNEF